MQCQALRSEGDEIAQLKSRKIAQLFDIRDTGEHVLGSENRRELEQVAWHLRTDARVPGTEFD